MSLFEPLLTASYARTARVAFPPTCFGDYGRFADRRYADNVGRFADTYNCIKTAFHDTDEDREDVGEDVGVVECGLYAIVCVGETSAPLLRSGRRFFYVT